MRSQARSKELHNTRRRQAFQPHCCMAYMLQHHVPCSRRTLSHPPSMVKQSLASPPARIGTTQPCRQGSSQQASYGPRARHTSCRSFLPKQSDMCLSGSRQARSGTLHCSIYLKQQATATGSRCLRCRHRRQSSVRRKRSLQQKCAGL